MDKLFLVSIDLSLKATRIPWLWEFGKAAGKKGKSQIGVNCSHSAFVIPEHGTCSSVKK